MKRPKHTSAEEREETEAFARDTALISAMAACSLRDCASALLAQVLVRGERDGMTKAQRQHVPHVIANILPELTDTTPKNKHT